MTPPRARKTGVAPHPLWIGATLFFAGFPALRSLGPVSPDFCRRF